MEGGSRSLSPTQRRAGYTLQGSGDFDADGGDDLLWRDAAGQLVIWFNGRRGPMPSLSNAPAAVDLDWVVRGVGDVDGDGRADILWRHTIGRPPDLAHDRRAIAGERRDFGAAGRTSTAWRTSTPTAVDDSCGGPWRRC